MEQGTVIFLNGTSSAGKSTIAKARQDSMERPFLHTGIDHFVHNFPSRVIVRSNGQQPGSVDGWLATFHDGVLTRVQIGPLGYKLIGGIYRAMAALADAGVDLIVDDVIYDQRVLQEAVNVLHPYPVWFIGVRCPLEVAERREQARGDRAKGGARTFYDLVHVPGIYDLEVDSAASSPEECAAHIKAKVQAGPAPRAFRDLKKALASKKD